MRNKPPVSQVRSAFRAAAGTVSVPQDDGIGLETEFLGRTFTSVQRSHPRAEYVSVGAFTTHPASFEGARWKPHGA